MAEIRWIKIIVDIFDDEKIKIIESLPEGDTIIVIWFKLLCLAGKKNDCGLIYITRDIPYTEESLTKILNRKIEIVRLALKTFLQFKMIEIESDILSILNWEKHQSADKLDVIREKNNQRVKKYREKQKQLVENINNDLDLRIKAKKNIYGEFKNVLLFEDEFKTLIQKYEEENTDRIIQKLSSYKHAHGKTYDSDYGAINQWVIEACEIKKNKKNPDLKVNV